jgi:Flp pilus assembly pilin Flp
MRGLRQVVAPRLTAWVTPTPGQGLMEYGMIIVAVAVVVILALFALGPAIGSMYSGSSNQIP